MENFDRKSMDWKDRHLNDTRYATVFLKNYIENHLLLSGSKPKKVRTFNGALTSYTRNLWGFSKDRNKDDTHHGLDALIVATMTEKNVQKVNNWSRYTRTKQKPEINLPWEGFRHEAFDAVSKIFISRAPNRKASGAIHKETIYGIRPSGGEHIQVVEKIPLIKLTQEKLERMFDKERNWRLYELLKTRLSEHNNKPKIAFEKPVYMPSTGKKQGNPPEVTKVRITTDHKRGVYVRNGLAENDRMVRIDIFKNKKGHFYFCPVYLLDVMKKTLPDKLVVAYKPWIEIDEQFQFMFSLHKNELIKLVSKKDEEFFGYYQGADVSTGSIKIIAHHSSLSKTSKGIKMMKDFKKYSVDYFGRYHEVKEEKRHGVEKYLHKSGIELEGQKQQPSDQKFQPGGQHTP